jgi:hypothetical protein
MRASPGEVAIALNVAAVTGQPFPSDVPDTEANRAMFDRMIAFADDAREQGMIIDIPAE